MPKHIHHNHQSLVILLHKHDMFVAFFLWFFPHLCCWKVSLFPSHRWRCQGLCQGFSLGWHVERWRGGGRGWSIQRRSRAPNAGEKFSGNLYPTNALLESLRIFFFEKKFGPEIREGFCWKKTVFFSTFFCTSCGKICQDFMGIPTSLRFVVCW